MKRIEIIVGKTKVSKVKTIFNDCARICLLLEDGTEIFTLIEKDATDLCSLEEGTEILYWDELGGCSKWFCIFTDKENKSLVFDSAIASKEDYSKVFTPQSHSSIEGLDGKDFFIGLFEVKRSLPERFVKGEFYPFRHYTFQHILLRQNHMLKISFLEKTWKS